jgi:hypothetical protein
MRGDCSLCWYWWASLSLSFLFLNDVITCFKQCQKDYRHHKYHDQHNIDTRV